jgi:hypothetical protein
MQVEAGEEVAERVVVEVAALLVAEGGVVLERKAQLRVRTLGALAEDQVLAKAEVSHSFRFVPKRFNCNLMNSSRNFAYHDHGLDL